LARRIILVDIDNTVSNAFWREAMVKDGWDAFHDAGEKDELLPDGVLLVNALAEAGCHVVGLTGRPEKWRGQTLAWLIDKGVVVHELLMRADKDHRSSPIMKLSVAQARFGDGGMLAANVAMIIDDREDVLEKFREAGVTTLLMRGRPR
jgi:hypothetical protein